jgi:hypothetical protein
MVITFTQTTGITPALTYYLIGMDTHICGKVNKKELKVCQGLEKYFTKVRQNQNIQAMCWL